MKRSIQRALRSLHLAFLKQGLPEKLALYFHALEPEDHEAFSDMVNAVRAVGYRFVSLEEHLEKAGPTAFISFDDNYRSWHRSLPLFDRLGVKAMFYVNSGPMQDRSNRAEQNAFFDIINHHGERETMTTAELRELRAAGHAIGCHTHTHRCLTRLSVSEAEEEIKRSRDELQLMLGEPVVHFSFPFGMPRHFNSSLGHYCRAIGLQTVAHATACQLFRRPEPSHIPRHQWRLEQSAEWNLANACIDGRLFVRLTGRSPVG